MCGTSGLCVLCSSISLHFSFEGFHLYGQQLQEIIYLHNNWKDSDQLSTSMNKFLPILFHVVSPVHLHCKVRKCRV